VRKGEKERMKTMAPIIRFLNRELSKLALPLAF